MILNLNSSVASHITALNVGGDTFVYWGDEPRYWHANTGYSTPDIREVVRMSCTTAYWFLLYPVLRIHRRKLAFSLRWDSPTGELDLLIPQCEGEYRVRGNTSRGFSYQTPHYTSVGDCHSVTSITAILPKGFEQFEPLIHILGDIK